MPRALRGRQSPQATACKAVTLPLDVRAMLRPAGPLVPHFAHIEVETLSMGVRQQQLMDHSAGTPGIRRESHAPVRRRCRGGRRPTWRTP